MKQIKIFSAALMLMLISITFSSCTSDDQDIAYYLNGDWAGYVSDGGRQYNVNMTFIQNNGDYYATAGIGYEYSEWGYLHASRTRFRWFVENSNIYIYYEDGTRVIVDYNQLPTSTTPGSRFSGYFIEERTGYELGNFQLIRVN